MYPDAKFIYLVRNPYAVFESTRSFFRNTLASIRLQSISDEELEHEILLNYRALYEHYEADKPLVPEGHLIEVRFEEFESHPLETAKAIYQKLSLGDFEQVRPAMEHYLEGQRGFRKKTYHSIRKPGRPSNNIGATRCVNGITGHDWLSFRFCAGIDPLLGNG